jgi:hypothetical protein
MMNRKIYLYGLILSLLVLPSCDSSPSMFLAQEAFEHKYILDVKYKHSDALDKFYRIYDFNKIDAVAHKIFGIQVYRMRCRAVVEITKDCFFVANKRRLILSSTKQGVQGLAPAKKGKRIILENNIEFEKHEQGWVWIRGF